MAIPGVDDLVSLLGAEDDPLVRLMRAEEVAAVLHDLGDRLLGSVVDHARAEGCSWSDIGEQLGVSRQAAQQRYASRLSSLTIADLVMAARFERFTERTRTALEDADRLARSALAEAVLPHHVLVAVLGAENLASDALRAAGLDVARLCRAASPTRGPRRRAGAGSALPVAAPLRRALEATLAEALRLGHNYIGTEHLLLGVLHDAELARRLAAHGLTLTAAREAVRARLSDVVQARS